ncbi:hypothetical protein AN958_01813 [Leucoagaricus sp. SymC.cos]|nr:hypothetical protein AN958_01813 [Leucoagaricus sp. SymC.cos]
MSSSSVGSLHPLRPPNLAASLPHAIWLAVTATLAAHVIPGASAYSWNFRSNPQQCQNATVELTGNGGQSPYRMLIIPFGASPLPNNVEARRISEQTFATGNERSGSVQINYPANSQFVAVVSWLVKIFFYCSRKYQQRSVLDDDRRPLFHAVLRCSCSKYTTFWHSYRWCGGAEKLHLGDHLFGERSLGADGVSDATGFGTGGTSVAAQVGSSSGSSCFDPTKNVSPDFVFSIEPANQIVQCQPMRIWWDPTQVQGMPNFLGVIPGGQSFAIPQGQITQVAEQGTGFTWIPNVRGGTTLMLIGGDNRGNGTAGSVLFVVSSGINNNQTCLDANSPSSTPGSPAGGTYPTGSTGAGSGGGSGGSNTGAIVGGVIGGLALLVSVVLALFYLRRRSRQNRRVKKRPVDLLHEDEDEEDDHRHHPNEQQQHQLDYYTPEPFTVPDPTLTSDAATTALTESHSGWGASSSGRPLSGTSYSRSDTPDLLGAVGGYGWAGASTTTSTSRKGGPQRMRPVNIVQHEDAGPPPMPDKEEEAETIELPPAYTAVQRTAVERGTTDIIGAESRPPRATPTDTRTERTT